MKPSVPARRPLLRRRPPRPPRPPRRQRCRAAAGAGQRAPAAAPAIAAGYWTDFRGPNRDGVYRERPILTNWPADGLKPIWKQPVGGGYASFVIAGGRAFTIEQRGPQEIVAAYDVATGRELWTSAWTATFHESMGGDGPRATPVWAAGRVFALGGLGELRCLDATTGALVWRTNILEDSGATNLQWGMSAAPLVVDDTIVVLPGGTGGSKGQSVVAYDRRTGKRAWSALNDQQAYASPMLVTLAGVRQILVFSASRVMGLTPDRGAVLWEYPWKTDYDVNAGQPIVIGDNRVFVSSGYGGGAAVVELTRSGSGEFQVREVWRNIRMKNQFTSSVLHDGFIYGLDESILACVDAATGELEVEGWTVRLRSGHPRQRPPDRARRGRRPRARARDAGSASGARALPGARGEDVEPSGDERRYPARAQHQRDGGVRSAAPRTVSGTRVSRSRRGVINWRILRRR